MTYLSRTRPETCLSDRALDMLTAGELPRDRHDAAEAHLPGCPMCAARYRELQDARAAFRLEAPRFEGLVPAAPAPGNWVSRRWVAAARARNSFRWRWFLGTACAATAALVLSARLPPPQPSGTRNKGGERIGFYVRHDGVTRQGGPGEKVRQGDRLQLVHTMARSRFVAVLTRDAAGAAAIAFPRGPLATRLDAGSEVPLPYSLELDAAPGVETLYGLFCDEAAALEPLREALARQGEATVWPADCHVDRVSYEKSP